MTQTTSSASPSSTAILDANRLPQLRRAIAWAIDTRLFASLALHGNTRWAPADLVTLALFWVWSECSTLTGAFAQARRLCEHLLGRVVLGTYQGLTAALVTWTGRLMPLLWQRLQVRMVAVGGSHGRIGPWLPLAVDGTRTTTPRTRANERAFAAKNYGHGRRARSRTKWKNKRRRSKPLSHPVAPQIWLTLVWHMGLRMPWAWQCGPSDASERHHFAGLLDRLQFPEKTLFCADAGFVGYDLWAAILGGGHHFLIRVGGNVRLLKGLGRVRTRGDVVWFWPNHAAAKDRPPLVLRLLTFRTGRRPVYAVTDVLTETALTPTQAAALYAKRWGVEVQFRSLKQTFGRGRLHSRTPDRAVVELEWALLGLWMVQLLTAAEQIPRGIGPDRTSVSLAVRVVRDAMRGGPPGSLGKAFRDAVKDDYQRTGSKAGRYRSGTKDRPVAGRPVLVRATPTQRSRYQQLRDEPEISLTA